MHTSNETDRFHPMQWRAVRSILLEDELASTGLRLTNGIGMFRVEIRRANDHHLLQRREQLYKHNDTDIFSLGMNLSSKTGHNTV